jgi:sugar transferase (PEP-CTERM/EpsH1 system associated)
VTDTRPLIAHIVDRLAVGGMENGLVNILNHSEARSFRHAVVCLRPETDFRRRIRNPEVEVLCIDKRPGKDPGAYLRLWALLRRLKPAIAHTRNLPVVDMVVPATAAGIPIRIHGEHGRDVLEETGGNRKYNALRRTLAPLVTAYVAVSRDIQGWLSGTVGLPKAKITQIYNGVDAKRFHPAAGPRPRPPVEGFDDGTVVIGTVGRMQTVKDQPNLARAFVHLVDRFPDGRRRLRLVMAGDGPLQAECEAILAEAGLSHLAWLPGSREDVPDIMRMLDIFVLPSRIEGVSNTILEAMATGLPVVATATGGNPELVRAGRTGLLVPIAAPSALAAALAFYAEDAERRRAHGDAARRLVEHEFGLSVMVGRYLGLYDRLLAARVRGGA